MKSLIRFWTPSSVYFCEKSEIFQYYTNLVCTGHISLKNIKTEWNPDNTVNTVFELTWQSNKYSVHISLRPSLRPFVKKGCRNAELTTLKIHKLIRFWNKWRSSNIETFNLDHQIISSELKEHQVKQSYPLLY